uniref:Uncharacterized protein n=1 Tax=Panagrolaimus sp. PS1159 TaxID=55785 RepID=A0AC35FDB5_9BILA
MPFIELNFSTYEAALALQKSLNQQLLILRRYSKFLGTVICVKRRRRPPRKWTGKILYFIHCFILIILSFIFIISIVMEFIQILSSQLSIIKIILFCTRLQSL